jgi:ribose transport system ATP-binding protein
MMPAALLELRDVSKSFGSTAVLRSVDLDLGANRVTGIVGENGAGKSTLLNIVSGLVSPDTGAMRLAGRPFAPASFAEASATGVSRVFQEQALIPNIGVYENILLSHEGRFVRFGQFVKRRAMIELAQAICDEAGIGVDVRRPTSDYSFSKRQLIEIARACLVPVRVVGAATPIVLLDEPTASLEKGDEEIFFRLLDKLRGFASVVFVSHRLTEVIDFCDDIVVFKDGEVVGRVDPASASERSLHAMMVGRDRDTDYYGEARQLAEGGPVVFAATGMTLAGAYDDVSLDVRAGEVLGIGGLLKSGKSELGMGLAGVVRPDQGTVRVGTGERRRPDIHALIAEGIGYVPAERLQDGMIAAFPVAWNISMASGADLFSNAFGLWRSAREIEVAERSITRLGIKARGPLSECRTLSGGNQQKVVLARWLCRELKVLILDNPTRGIDAGAKQEVYALVRSLAEQGIAIVLITDELLELIGLSNRIAIMQHGRIVAECPAPAAAKPSEQHLVALMLSSPAEAAPREAAA